MRGWAQFVSMQNHYNLIYREEEREMNPLCRAKGIGLIPWSPLARGFLAGNRQRGRKDATLREQHDDYGHSLYYADADYDVADRVVEVARERRAADSGGAGVDPAAAGVAAPIISVTKREQLDQLVAGLDVKLSDADAARVGGSVHSHTGCSVTSELGPVRRGPAPCSSAQPAEPCSGARRLEPCAAGAFSAPARAGESGTARRR